MMLDVALERDEDAFNRCKLIDVRGVKIAPRYGQIDCENREGKRGRR
jgi:hypothetical protein